MTDQEVADYAEIARQAFIAGQESARAEMDARWNEIAAPVVNGTPHTEMETRRWGPGGREHFADPRPGDFPGRGATRQPEHNREAEAS